MSQIVTQCKMLAVGSCHVYVAFIPAKFAKKGAVVTIDGQPGEWRVDTVYGSMTVSEATERSQDYKKQRDASDV